MKGVGSVRFGRQHPGRSTRFLSPAFVAVVATAVAAALSMLPLTAPPAQAASCLVAPTGLEAWWPGDGSADELVHYRDGLLGNGAGYSTGTVGQAFAFDGLDDRVTVPDGSQWDLGASDFTQAMWVRMDSTDSEVFTSHDEGLGADHAWLFLVENGVLYFYVTWPDYWEPMVFANWSPSTATWYHVAVTRVGDEWTLFVNGAPIGMTSWSAAIPAIEAPVRLGYADADSAGKYALDGDLDEVMFFHRGLSPIEIAAIHGAGSAGLCAPVSSSLTLTASDTSVWAGIDVTLSGTLAFGPGPSVAGRTVTVTRRIAGLPTKTFTPTTTADGSYSLTDRPPEGKATYTAWFEGGDNAVPATAKVTVTATMRTSSLSLTSEAGRLRIGQQVKLTAHLTGGSTNRTVAIEATPVGGRTTLVKRARVTAAGNLTVTVRPRATTRYLAKYAGDATWTSATSRGVRVTVAAYWKAKAYGGYATAGKYRLYHWTSTCRLAKHTGCPWVNFVLKPLHPNEPVTLTFQYLDDGRWISHRYRWRLHDDGDIWVVTWYTDHDIVGVPHRVRASFDGDGNHAGSTSRWVYWKVTS